MKAMVMNQRISTKDRAPASAWFFAEATRRQAMPVAINTEATKNKNMILTGG